MATQNEKNLVFKQYVISVVFAFLAIFTHELTIVLPLLFLLYDFYFQRAKIPSDNAGLIASLAG